MMRVITSAMILSLVGATPALAVDAHCDEQLRALGSQLSQKSGGKDQLDTKYEVAQQLCQSGKEDAANDLARQIRDGLAGRSGMSGSSTPGSDKPAPRSR